MGEEEAAIPGPGKGCRAAKFRSAPLVGGALAAFQRADGAPGEKRLAAAPAMGHVCLDHGDDRPQFSPCGTVPELLLGRSRTRQPGTAYPATTGYDSSYRFRL